MDSLTKNAQFALVSGKFTFTETHEDIVLNQKFSPSDFAP